MSRVATVIATAMLVTACGSDEDHNEADAEFATAMIEHHAQAIQVANSTIGRADLDPRIARLAEQIRVGHSEEIDTLSGWLEEWGEPVPETGFATGDSHSHSEDGGASGSSDIHDDLPGMMSAGEMTALAEAPDADFEARWLEAMIDHHAGAIALTADVAADGESDQVVDLAEQIRRNQKSDVSRMRTWRDET